MKTQSRGSAWLTALWLTTGLLAKAYFLVFAVLACGVAFGRL